MIESRARQALAAMGYAAADMTLLRHKDGVVLFRVSIGNERRVLKLFTRVDCSREIALYHLLAAHGVKTLIRMAEMPDAFLMEDLDFSPHYRLGRREDCQDVQVMAALGRWYRALHQAELGKNVAYYSELDLFTPSRAREAAARTASKDAPFWRLLADSHGIIGQWLSQAPQTLCYNDFHWENMVVARGGTEAFMLDYNLMGRGLAAGDLDNALWFSDDKARQAFLAGYGRAIDMTEQAVWKLLGPLSSLYIALDKGTALPHWAEDTVRDIRSGRLAAVLMEALDQISRRG